MQWNNKYNYPKSTRSIVDGSRHYSVNEERLPSVTTILKATESELTRIRYGIKEDKYEEVLALQEFKMSKDTDLSEEDSLKTVLDERPDYVESTIKNIGIEIKNDVKETPLYFS